MPRAKKTLTPAEQAAADEKNLKLIEGEKALAEQRAAFEQEKADYEEKKAKDNLKPSELPVHDVQVEKADLTKHTIKIKEQVLKNTKGENVAPKDYFFAGENETAVAPGYFNKACGFPVDREDLVSIFDRVFNPEDNFLLLKTADKEIYGVLVPLKFATQVSHEEESRLGDCQYHAVSFIPDGSVNLDKFEREMKKISAIIGYSKR